MRSNPILRESVLRQDEVDPIRQVFFNGSPLHPNHNVDRGPFDCFSMLRVHTGSLRELQLFLGKFSGPRGGKGRFQDLPTEDHVELGRETIPGY